MVTRQLRGSGKPGQTVGRGSRFNGWSVRRFRWLSPSRVWRRRCTCTTTGRNRIGCDHQIHSDFFCSAFCPWAPPEYTRQLKERSYCLNTDESNFIWITLVFRWKFKSRLKISQLLCFFLIGWFVYLDASRNSHGKRPRFLNDLEMRSTTTLISNIWLLKLTKPGGKRLVASISENSISLRLTFLVKPRLVVTAEWRILCLVQCTGHKAARYWAVAREHG